MFKSFLRCLNRGMLPISVVLIVGAFGGLAQGQTNFSIPVVTIRASDPIAMESGDTATFEVDRHGDTNVPLLVYYLIGGTASRST